MREGQTAQKKFESRHFDTTRRKRRKNEELTQCRQFLCCTHRFGSYPQDLVLRFSCGHSRIRQIQILSHQYKIASKLDFWMGSWKGTQDVQTDPSGTGTQSGRENNNEYDNSFEGNGEITFDHGNDNDNNDSRGDSSDDSQKKNLPVLQFQKLGSISFDSNAASNYSKRELRSINFDVEGEYLRVVIRQCHVNPLNIYHQASQCSRGCISLEAFSPLCVRT